MNLVTFLTSAARSRPCETAVFRGSAPWASYERLTARVAALARHLREAWRELVAAAASSTEEAAFALTPLQQGMLFHSMLTPGSSLYLNQVSCRITGEVDTDAFLEAWRAVVRRHPALRAEPHWARGEEPLQIIRQGAELPVERQVWPPLPEDMREQRVGGR